VRTTDRCSCMGLGGAAGETELIDIFDGFTDRQWDVIRLAWFSGRDSAKEEFRRAGFDAAWARAWDWTLELCGPDVGPTTPYIPRPRKKTEIAYETKALTPEEIREETRASWALGPDEYFRLLREHRAASTRASVDKPAVRGRAA
jgi:hypothetical protein